MLFFMIHNIQFVMGKYKIKNHIKKSQSFEKMPTKNIANIHEIEDYLRL